MKNPTHSRSSTQRAIHPPIADQRIARYGSFATFLITFLMYLRTLTPGLHFGDGPELAAAAHVLGVPHPTGYPLYMLLAKLWLTLTGSSDIILRTTLFSALCTAAAAALWQSIASNAFQKLLQRDASKPVALLSTGAGLMVGFLFSVWNSATITEAYALQFLIMTAFVRAVQTAEASPVAPRQLLIASILLAAGLAHHRLSLVLILPYVGLWWRCIRNKRSSGETVKLPWVAAAMALLLGCMLYLYLPLRASARPAINWGNTVQLDNLIHHIRGTEYLNRSLLRPGQEKKFSSTESQDFLQLHTQHMVSDFAAQGVSIPRKPVPKMQWNRVFLIATGLSALAGVVLLLGVLAGGWKWFSCSRLTAGTVGLIALQNLALTYAYNIADISDYCIFPWAAAWVMLYMSIFHFAVQTAPIRVDLLSYAGPVLALLVAMGNFGKVDRSSDTAAEALAAVILPEERELMPEGSILLTGADADTFAAWYQKIARKVRPDVLVFAGNFIWKSWYHAFFSPEQIQAYNLKFAPAVARDPGEYVNQLLHGVLSSNVGKRPVFTSISDPLVLERLAGIFNLQPIAAAYVPSPVDLHAGTTVTLIKISPKGN